jgi:hypothetical protein
MVEDVIVNDLPLPAALTAAIHEGRWPADLPAGRLREVFDDEPVFPRWYSLEGIAAVNRTWLAELNPVFLGSPSEVTPPGDVDPRRSLLIGELGPDQLVALDYRASNTSPGVIYLGPEMRSPWRHVAASVGELFERLEL